MTFSIEHLCELASINIQRGCHAQMLRSGAQAKRCERSRESKMDEKTRKKVFFALHKKLKNSKGKSCYGEHPVLALWRSSDLDTCEAIVTGFAQYTNLQDRLAAEELQSLGPIQVKRLLENLVAKYEETTDSSFRELLELIQIKMETLDTNQTQNSLFPLCLQIVVARRIDTQVASKKVLNLAATALARDGDVDALIDFLGITDKVAVNLISMIPLNAKDEFLFAGYLHAHLAHPREGQSLINTKSEPILYIQEREVESFAQLAYSQEDAILRAEPDEYPADYTKPMGFSIADFGKIGRRHRHSYFSTRLACAALMLSRCSAGELSYRKWALLVLLSKPVVRRNVYEKSRLLDLTDASSFTKAVFQYYNETNKDFYSKKFFQNGMTSEYSAAWEWQETLGKDGLTAAAAEQLLKGTRGDADFVLKVLTKLLKDSNYSKDPIPSIAVKIALAGKFGVHFDVIQGEPTYKYRKRDGYQYATEQIHNIQRLCHFVALNTPGTNKNPEVDGFIYTNVGILYYEDWPNKRILRQDFKLTNNGPSDWKKRSSNGHVGKDEFAPMDHLWLYGKGFQELVDQAIDEVGTSLAVGDTPYLGDGDRFTRFTLLIPKCPIDVYYEKTLSDFPGDAAMKRVLRYLGRTESVNGFNLKSDLFEPIDLRAPVLPENSMFKVGR